LSMEDMRTFCCKYGAGGPDPCSPELPLKVNWRQFVKDFDDVRLPEERQPNAEGELLQSLMELRAEAVRIRLDMSDAFEEFTGSLKERNSGTMTKNRFRATMGQLFSGKLKNSILNQICYEYGTGDPDAREGGWMKVRWKAFADDFDRVPPMPPPDAPDPTPDIIEYMRSINHYCNLHAIDLESEFEDYLGGGKEVCTTDIMPTAKFQRALGVLVGKASNSFPHDGKKLELICRTYGAGAKDLRNPNLFEAVQWREFARDLRDVQPMPFLRSMTGKVNLYSQGEPRI